MDITTLTQAISTLGFPIVCVIAMAWFIYQVFQKTTTQSQENMERVQARCAEREEKLFEEIKENREVNAQAIATIALYADKLDIIQTDIREIKEDLTILATKQS